MRGADVYYGAVADNYDASRQVKAKWQAEQAAVDAFLTAGPVLDVPFGTGRFVPIYWAKGLEFAGVDISSDMLEIARRKFPDVSATLGSAFDLQFDDGAFATAVCVRFLEWLPLPRAQEVLERLRLIAGTLIVTITHGDEGEPEAFTYDYGKFLRAIDGLLIEDRRVTAHVRDMISEIFKLRPARWSDVLAQFQHDHPRTAGQNVQRLADKYAAFLGLPSVPVREDTVSVRAEYWSGEAIAEVVRTLSGHRFILAEAPRRLDMPVTVIERGDHRLMIDGRRRANMWKSKPGPHPVLVVRPHG